MVTAGCVWPRPPAGTPTPALTVTVSAPLAGAVTVSATATNFTPTAVSFYMDTLASTPIVVDTQAPFTAVVPVATLSGGAHTVYVTGNDGTYTAYQVAPVQPDKSKPNEVVILLDDLDQMDTPYWDALPRTKALLADKGMTFDNSFVSDPTCCPARATLLTGDYPQNTGVYDNSAPDGGYPGFQARQSDTIATRLKADGYTTALIGKYLNGYQTTDVPPGWDEFWGMLGFPYYGVNYQANHNGTVESYGNSEADYSTDVISRLALDFIDRTEASDAQPFFLYLTPTAPHWPLRPPARYDPNPMGSITFPNHPDRNEHDVSDKPTWLRDGYPELSDLEVAFVQWYFQWAAGSLLAVDDMVANVVQRLDQRGELANTVFVFTSDNGLNLGAHRLTAKQAPYDESLRVPLVISGRGIAPGSSSQYVINNDLAPTLMALAGAGDQPDMDGRSLVPLLRQESGVPWRDDFLIQYHGTGSPTLDTFADVQAAIATSTPLTDIPSWRGIRSTRWAYIQWYRGDVHEYELYDMQSDPWQLQNLVATPAGVQQYAAVTTALQARLEQLATCSGATCRS